MSLYQRLLAVSRLPSLVTLELLRVAAREESISVAAERLGMAQPAASRRIAALEADLGTALLRRHRRGVELTEAGTGYVEAVAPALDAIRIATDALREGDSGGPLRLRVYSTVAARWLLPRLPSFQAANPGIGVKLDTTVRPVAFPNDKVDLAIQFGRGEWPGTFAELLIEDSIEPVCTPDFARRHAREIAAGSLGGLQLLDSRYRRTDWQDWSARAGCDLAGARFMPFPSSLLAFHAAVQGLGMAIAQTSFLADELASGALVAPFSHPVRREMGYYLVGPRSRLPARARAFCRWAAQQASIP